MSATPGPFDPARALGEAVSLQRRGQVREAEKICARVLKALPDHFDALNLLGTVKAQQGRFGEAQRLFAAAAKINPRSAQAWSNLGQALYALKQPAQALESLAKAVALAPDDPAILGQHANVLLALGRPSEALAEFRKALTRAPQHIEARMGSGAAQAALGYHEQALTEFDAALKAAPGHPGVQYNRGVALLNLRRYPEAIAAYDAALAAVPGHANAWLNRGRALAQLNRHDEAIESYDRALAIHKDQADARFNKALSLLARGNYALGFAEYEYRWRRTGMPPQPGRGRPLWRGEYLLAHKTILLHAEQGLGDTIQFARYAPLVAAAGATVVLEVQPELKSLLARLGGATTVMARGEPLPPFDVHAPLGSLPLALKTEPSTVPPQIPYLSVDEAQVAKWSNRLGTLPQPRIAIVWLGNPTHDNDRNRSIELARLAPLFDVPASFVSVQRDVRGEDAEMLATEKRITHIGGDLTDFTDTAAVLALCDLVIGVDTSVVHLAGAMGRPVWVLVPFAPDWRWGLKGETTLWYPTARLFRQTAFDDWDSVIASVAHELRRFVQRIGENAAGK